MTITRRPTRRSARTNSASRSGWCPGYGARTRDSRICGGTAAQQRVSSGSCATVCAKNAERRAGGQIRPARTRLGLTRPDAFTRCVPTFVISRSSVRVRPPAPETVDNQTISRFSQGRGNRGNNSLTPTRSPCRPLPVHFEGRRTEAVAGPSARHLGVRVSPWCPARADTRGLPGLYSERRRPYVTRATAMVALDAEYASTVELLPPLPPRPQSDEAEREQRGAWGGDGMTCLTHHPHREPVPILRGVGERYGAIGAAVIEDRGSVAPIAWTKAEDGDRDSEFNGVAVPAYLCERVCSGEGYIDRRGTRVD